MRLSTDRILTSHVGSLPRPDALSDLLLRREFGEHVDVEVFSNEVLSAVKQAVARQVEAGVDIVSDGEMSKIGYATYIKDRCSGFSGDSPRNPPADLARYPAFMQRTAEQGQAPSILRPCCTGEIETRDRSALEADISHFREALEGAEVVEGFMNAASPGVIGAFLPNQHYPSERDYLEALARVMREEYEAINQAGFVLQMIAPISRWRAIRSTRI